MKVEEISENWLRDTLALYKRPTMDQAKKLYPVLGCGAKGCAFDIGNNKVKKIFYNDPAYHAYLKIAEKYPNNPYFPHIYSIEVADDNAYIVTMEKLFPIKIDTKQRMEKWQIGWLVTWYDMKNMKPLLKPRTMFHFAHIARIWRGIDPEKIKRENPDLWQVAMAIWDLTAMGANADLKTRNTMMRANKQLVISDPVA